jgi:methylenetetrahydrofolate dehydrogenase (NADP+) / methenyltetrahydrofolate cyclohydrolase
MTEPKILRGDAAAAHLLDKTRAIMATLAQLPELHVVRVGEDPASVSYVRLKDEKAKEIGMNSTVHALPESTSQAELLEVIDRLNLDSKVSGILVQLPVPKHIDSATVLERIRPDKDVDGFHAVNVGKLWSGEQALFPCTAVGVIEMCKFYGLELAGKNVVIVGRSNIVGKPLTALMLRENATVTIAHSRSKDLGAITRGADILVAAVGSPGLITAEMVTPGTVIIDVGVNRVQINGKNRLVGDVQKDAYALSSAYTPVPGGVGPLTVSHLLLNTALAARGLQENT